MRYRLAFRDRVRNAIEAFMETEGELPELVFPNLPSDVQAAIILSDLEGGSNRWVERMHNVLVELEGSGRVRPRLYNPNDPNGTVFSPAICTEVSILACDGHFPQNDSSLVWRIIGWMTGGGYVIRWAIEYGVPLRGTHAADGARNGAAYMHAGYRMQWVRHMINELERRMAA